MRQILLMGLVGNAFEWVEFTIFSSMSALISHKFFPASDPLNSILLMYLVFAMGFFARPLGGLIFGYIGDIRGRKTALLISMIGMVVPTTLIGFLPTYESIGIVSPIILSIIRIAQGITLGGEAGGIYSYLAEKSGPNNKSFMCSIGLMGNSIGFLIGMLIVYVCVHIIPKDDFDNWGWRVPFIFSLFLGIFGIYLRKWTEETDIFLEYKKTANKQPIIEAVKYHKKNILIAIISYAPAVSMYYISVTFLSGFMTERLHRPIYEFNTMLIFALLADILTLPFFAMMADRLGIKKYIFASMLLLIIFVYPSFYIICNSGYEERFAGVIFMVLLSTIYKAPIPGFITQLFPTETRYTSVSLAVNLCCALFGGAMPYICSYLIILTGHNGSVPVFVMFITMSAFLILFNYHKFDQSYATNIDKKRI
ncbi:MAG: MFS transporter [Rickettsiaceae bacterium]|nr:MFS transporter [Rickettsiaceae bacterium]